MPENNNNSDKTNRRDFLTVATTAVGAVGVGAVVWPIVNQMNPDASVKAVSTTEVDIGSIELGKTITVLWRGKPVFIRKRTKLDIKSARKANLEELNRFIEENKQYIIVRLTRKEFDNLYSDIEST